MVKIRGSKAEGFLLQMVRTWLFRVRGSPRRVVRPGLEMVKVRRRNWWGVRSRVSLPVV